MRAGFQRSALGRDYASDWTIQSSISAKIVVIGIVCLYGNDSMYHRVGRLCM